MATPIKNGKVSFPYKARYKTGGLHKGEDYAVKTGTPVYAAVAGKVVHSGKQSDGGWTNRGWGDAFGIHVLVDNVDFPNGDPGLWCGYMHLSKVSVKLGQTVKKGQLIGYTGNTGNTTGPHLHFQILATRYWNPVKPAHRDPERWRKA